MLRPTQSEGSREIVLFTTVVGNMSRPPKALFVRDPVSPVAEEIDRYIAEYKRPPGNGDVQWAPVVKKQNNEKEKAFCQCSTNQMANAYPYGCKSVFLVVVVIVLAPEIPFQYRQ